MRAINFILIAAFAIAVSSAQEQELEDGWNVKAIQKSSESLQSLSNSISYFDSFVRGAGQNAIDRTLELENALTAKLSDYSIPKADTDVDMFFNALYKSSELLQSVSAATLDDCSLMIGKLEAIKEQFQAFIQEIAAREDTADHLLEIQELIEGYLNCLSSIVSNSLVDLKKYFDGSISTFLDVTETSQSIIEASSPESLTSDLPSPTVGYIIAAGDLLSNYAEVFHYPDQILQDLVTCFDTFHEAVVSLLQRRPAVDNDSI